MKSAGTTLVAVLAFVVALLAGTRGARTQAALSALPAAPAAPADNPTTPEKVELGRLLFWDPVLSGDRDVACATCHHPRFGYAEDRDLSIGASGHGLGASRRFAPGSAGRRFAAWIVSSAPVAPTVTTGRYSPTSQFTCSGFRTTAPSRAATPA